jgi:serine phosphatase RsbU (regulator of sigma subunit)
VLEARDPQGTAFGRDRLVDLLEREAAAAHPPPETVRRVTRAVREHQHGALQDDATLLLARWDVGTDVR